MPATIIVLVWFQLQGGFGPSQSAAWRLLAAGLLAGLLLMFSRPSPGKTVLGVATAVLIPIAPPTLSPLMFAFGVAHINNLGPRPSLTGLRLGSSLLAVSLLLPALESVGALHSAAERLAPLLGVPYPGHSEVAPRPGPTFSLLPALVTALSVAHAGASGPLPNAGVQRVLITSVLFGVWMIALATLPLVQPPSSSSMEVLTAALPGRSMLLLVVGSFLAAVRSRHQLRFEASTHMSWAFMISMVGAVLLPLLPLLVPPAPSGTIRVLNRGGLDWVRPTHGNYSTFDQGMFGLLPVYSRADGFAFDLLPGDVITTDGLAGVDLLLLINTGPDLAIEERKVLHSFLWRGGNVLVIADHTNVFGVMDALNPVLQEYGAALRFDSAYHARAGWYGCLDAALHPVTVPADSAFYPGHGIGASIEVTWRFRRFLSSRYAFSDIGVEGNVMGSFLGDYAYSTGELVGDLALAAWRPVGRGRLVIYGDTSAFQNLSLPKAWDAHVLPLFTWLSSPLSWTESDPLRIVYTILALVSAAGLLAGRVRLPHITVAFLVIASVALCTLQVHRAFAPRARVAEDTLLVDESHLPRIGHWRLKWNDVSPVHLAAARAAMRSMTSSALDVPGFLDARAVVFVAPSREFTSRDVKRLQEYMQGGGTIILAAGHPDQEESMPLLRSLGVWARPVPLGTFPMQGSFGVEADWAPRFWDAYPLEWTADAAKNLKALFVHGEYTVAAFVKVGAGGAVIIGDTRFFSGANIEGTWGYHRGNLKFLYSIFSTLLNVAHKGMPPFFDAPSGQN